MQTDVLLSPVNVVQPDVFFVQTENNMDIVGAVERAGIRPTSAWKSSRRGMRAHDLRRKRDLYARFGVREYWLVDPDT